MIKSLAQLLHTLHQAGFVHCNLEPRNILFLPNSGCWTFADLTHVTPCNHPASANYWIQYAAPEAVVNLFQVYPLRASKQLDAWSLGVIAFELLMGTTWAAPADNTPVRLHPKISLGLEFCCQLVLEPEMSKNPLSAVFRA